MASVSPIVHQSPSRTCEAYPPRFEWSFQTDHPSEDEKLCWNPVLFPEPCVTLCQKTEVKVDPRSDIMLTGTPWRQTIRLTYNLASLSVEYIFLMGKKWTVFVNLSTITQMASYPLDVRGKPLTKSMAIMSHFHSGMGYCCNNPEGLWCSSFTCWQVRHLETNSAISLFIPFPNMYLSSRDTSW